MRIVLAAGIAALVIGALGAGAGSAQLALHKPTVTISFGAAVVVKGKYFKPRELVTVTLVSTDAKWSRKARATLHGTFSVGLGAISLNSCSPYTLKVIGSLHSHYAYTHPTVPC